jgi:ribokinase
MTTSQGARVAPNCDVVTLGDVNIDVIAHFREFPVVRQDALAVAVEVHCGGSAANTALGLARFGLRVGLIGRVGRDPWGAIARRELREAGVRVVGLQSDPSETTGLIYIIVTPEGERTMLSHRGANTLTDPERVRERHTSRARLFHLSGYALLVNPQRSAALRAWDMAARRGLTMCLDPGLAPSASPELRALLPRTHVLLPTLDEAQTLTGEGSPDRCVRALLDLGAGTIALKLGSAGCLVASKSMMVHVPAFPVEACDTTGAGDAFNAGLLAALLEGLDLYAAAVVANACGALAVRQIGAGTRSMHPAAALGLLCDDLDPRFARHLEAVERAAGFLDRCLRAAAHPLEQRVVDVPAPP